MRASKLLMVLGGAFAFVVACRPSLPPTVQAQEKAQLPKWEYKVVDVTLSVVSGKGTEATLKPLGEDGWELVAASLNGDGAFRYVFKRPKK